MLTYLSISSRALYWLFLSPRMVRRFATMIVAAVGQSMTDAEPLNTTACGERALCSKTCTIATCNLCRCAGCKACVLPDPVVLPHMPTDSLVEAGAADTACLMHGGCSLVCFTTTPKRLNATHHTLAALSQQSAPNRVAIALPPGAKAPLFLTNQRAIVVRLSQDFGPVSKLVGCLQAAEHLQLPPTARIAITDDDWIRSRGWLRAVEGSSLGSDEVASLSHTGLPNAGYDNRVRGAYGYAATFATFGSSENLLRFLRRAPAHCRYVDDVALTAYLRGVRHARVKSHPYPNREYQRLMGDNPSWMANRWERLSSFAAARERDNRLCNITLGEELGINPLEWIVSQAETSRRA